MKCIHYCCSTANRSLLVALTYMLQRNCQRQLSHARRRATKQDTKLIALSTVSSIRLVFITVKRTSAFVDRGGNYRCVIIVVLPRDVGYVAVRSTVPRQLLLPTKTGAIENCRPNRKLPASIISRSFDSLGGVFCQQESNDALILYWDLCAIGFTRGLLPIVWSIFLYFIYLFIYYYFFWKIFLFFIFIYFFCLSDLGRAGSELDARRLLSSCYDLLFAVVATRRSVRVHFLTEASCQPGADDDNNNNDSRITGYFHTTPVTLTLGQSLPDLNAELNNQVEQFTCRGSGFVLDTVTKLAIVFARFRDLN